MGRIVEAKCKKCNLVFEYSDGGGFMFEILRCTKCGEVTSTDRGKEKQKENTPCPCGGVFKVHAPVRCPKCKSDQLTDQKTKMYFD
jgi:ssDNA-binding Zn-finger/Zn-ribbon topoisomerase 1